MALPVIATVARVGVVALSAYALTRRIEVAPYDMRGEDAMDDVSEGLGIRRDQNQANATYRWKRVIRFKDGGPALEVDLAALGRIKARILK